jgi:hypothetical protein
LNLEEIMKLEGQDLTDAVAIHVMKWTYEVRDNGYGYPAPFWVKCDLSNIAHSDIYDNRYRFTEAYNFWQPHRDFNTMNKVIQKMRESGYGTFQTRSYDFTDTYDSSFTCHYGICEKHGNKEYRSHGSEDIEGSTMQESVLRAALVATLIVSNNK